MGAQTVIICGVSIRKARQKIWSSSDYIVCLAFGIETLHITVCVCFDWKWSVIWSIHVQRWCSVALLTVQHCKENNLGEWYFEEILYIYTFVHVAWICSKWKDSQLCYIMQMLKEARQDFFENANCKLCYVMQMMKKEARLDFSLMLIMLDFHTQSTWHTSCHSWLTSFIHKSNIKSVFSAAYNFAQIFNQISGLTNL